MWPWNFFGNKSNFDPFKYMSEGEFQQTLEKWMKQAFPEYIHSIINNQNPGNNEKKTVDNNSSPVQSNVFETHDDIFIRIPIQDEETLNNLKVYYSLNKCMIDGLDKNDRPQTIVLPATVKKKGAKAIYRDQVLEIKIPKSLDWQYSEIDVDKF